jgi:drug/metabolite transporter (DMT)-like permease
MTGFSPAVGLATGRKPLRQAHEPGGDRTIPTLATAERLEEILTEVTIATGMQRSMSAADWAKLLLLGAIWGGSFFFARVAVAEMHPLTLVMFRVLIAAAALHVYLLARGPSFRLALPLAGSFFLLALVNNVLPFSLIFTGQTAMGAGLAAVLNSTTPFWTILIANAVTSDEKLSWNKVAGVLLGIAGVAVMVGPGVIASLGGPVWAKFALIGASLSYAVALVFSRRFKAVPPAIVATGQLTASTIVMIPLVLLWNGPAGLFAASPPVWAAVFALALVSTAFAYILYFGVIGSAGATNASLVTLIVPVSAILLGFIFLGERLELFEVGGMLLIGLGLVTIDGRVFGRR